MKDLKGKTFNSWTVLSFSHRRAGEHYWLLRCDCGYEGAKSIRSVTTGRSKMCRKCRAKFLSNKLLGKPPVQMSSALSAKRLIFPCFYNSLSVKNLPKGCIGPKNGNWRGGTSKARQEFRHKNSAKISKFRKLIVKRDKGACRNCGSKIKPEVHHIVALAQHPEFAFTSMNAVTLCKQCHSMTESYCGRARFEKCLGLNIFCVAIPHHWHSYSTIGNWAFSESGSILIFSSHFEDARYEFLIQFHEMIEAVLCRYRGITDEDVTDFDARFEAEREQGLHSLTAEDGDDTRAPYRAEHFTATTMERMMAAELGVDWADYEQAIANYFNVRG